MTQRIHKIILAFVVLSCVMPGVARAGRYHVYSCRTPSGAAAPVDGWSGSKTGSFSYIHDTCGEPGGSLLAALGDQPIRTANTDIASWEFAAPAGEILAAATLWRAGDAYGGSAINASYQFWTAAPGEHEIFDQCINGLGCSHEGVIGEPLESANRLAIPSPRLGTHIFARASCGGAAEYECPAGQGDPNNYAAALYLYAADLTLEQTAGPNVSNVGGELASATAIAGTTDLTFTATDPGAGVYEAEISVDGTPVQTTVLDEAGGHCHDVGQTTDGLPAFLYLQPCPSSLSADVGLDTTGLSRTAPHHLVVRVLDAAGNAAPVLDRTVTVANPATSPGGPGGQGAGGAGDSGTGPAGQGAATPAAGSPNGTGASPQATLAARWRRSARSLLTTTFTRREAIVGRLTNLGGAPIAGALVELSATPAFAGAASVCDERRAHARRRHVLDHPPRRSSRRAPSTSSTARMWATCVRRPNAPCDWRSKAPLTLSISPRTTPPGRDDPLPGAAARRTDPARWQVAGPRGALGPRRLDPVPRRAHRRHGRYRASYRFRFAGPARYQFRVVCEGEADYPFATGVIARDLGGRALTGIRAPPANRIGRRSSSRRCCTRARRYLVAASVFMCIVGDWVRRPARPAAERERKDGDERERREAGPKGLGPAARRSPCSWLSRPARCARAPPTPQVAISPLERHARRLALHADQLPRRAGERDLLGERARLAHRRRTAAPAAPTSPRPGASFVVDHDVLPGRERHRERARRAEGTHLTRQHDVHDRAPRALPARAAAQPSN